MTKLPDTPDKALCPLIEKWPHDRCKCPTHGQLSCHAAEKSCPTCRRCQLESWLHSSGLTKLIEAGDVLLGIVRCSVHTGYWKGCYRCEAVKTYNAALRQFEEASR